MKYSAITEDSGSERGLESKKGLKGWYFRNCLAAVLTGVCVTSAILGVKDVIKFQKTKAYSPDKISINSEDNLNKRLNNYSLILTGSAASLGGILLYGRKEEIFC